MSHFAFLLVFTFFLCPTITLQQTLPPKAVNPERIKLLKEALSWMTFRKNGELASEQELEPFFEALKDRYLKSKYYRTMIIAFMHSVLPKLTLKENDPCDPTYTLEYRDSFNNSVTDGQIKKFLWKSYDKRGDATRQFCDYREGLVCSNLTRKCECPIGSKMEQISQGSAEKRCFLQENQICTLLDLDHDPSSNYGALKMHLPEMILNLEKPLSCRMGTQCRFKSNAVITPLCYEVNNGPWDKGQWDIDFGEECTLGLYGDTGQCASKYYSNRSLSFGAFPGFTCFNFGPRSRPKSPFLGFCEFELGPLSHVGSLIHSSQNGFQYEPGLMIFVSPATTPLRGQAYRDYARQYLRSADGYFANLNLASLMAQHAGYRCNIRKSEKKLELWKFYKSLEDTPSPGKDYVATEAELLTKFQEVMDLKNDKSKICRFRTELYLHSEPRHALRCVLNSTDAEGNDGRCEMIPENEDVTFEWAKSLSEYQKKAQQTYDELDFAEKVYRKDIYEPELECDPKLGPPPGSYGAPPSTDSDVLEGGYCPPEKGCYEDYSDYSVDYDKDCEFKEAKPKLHRNCQKLEDKRYYGSCEKKQLNKKIGDETEAMTSDSQSKRGDACNHEFESKLRKWINLDWDVWYRDENRYKWLIEFYNFTNGIGGTVTRLCDRKKLLECSESGICECWSGTKPREVVLEGGTTIYSDYCYMTSGTCHPYDARFIFGDASKTETKEINRHYNASEGEGGSTYYSTCEGSNWCVYTDTESWTHDCTTENTGTTGYIPELVTTTTVGVTTERRTTTPKDESNLMCVGKNCGWQEAGNAQKEIHVGLKMMILIKMINVFGII